MPARSGPDGGVPAESGSDNRPIAVIDLDGVLADVRHRLRYVEKTPKDWDAFFAGVRDDPLLVEGKAVADRLAVDHDLIYLTGRPERSREDTLAWLDHYRLPRGRLVMRRDGDRRPARQAKPRMIEQLLRGRSPAVVVDDDPAVCAAFARRGWPVLQADWMLRPAALDEAQEKRGRT